MGSSHSTPTSYIATAITRLEGYLAKLGDVPAPLTSHPYLQSSAGRFEHLYGFARYTLRRSVQEIAEAVRWQGTPPRAASGWCAHALDVLKRRCP